MTKMIEITAKRDGFRRAGIAHHGTQAWPADRFTLDQLAELKAERWLAVREYEDRPAPAPAEGAPKGK